MLSSHPKLSMTRRTYLWTHFYGRYGDLSSPDNFDRCLAAILEQKSVQSLQLDPLRLRQEFHLGEPTYERLFALIHSQYAGRIGKPRWGDQLASIERFADPIFTAYPDAKMIHMVRDPRDRYQAARGSSRRRAGRAGWELARWIESVSLGLRNLRRYPDRYLIVRYEDLTARREVVLREICSFLGEEFVSGMLTMEGAMRYREEERDGAGELEEWSRAAGGSSEKPSEGLPAREAAWIQVVARQSILTHGYPLNSIRLAPRDRLLLYAVDWPAGLAGMVAWRLRKDLPENR
jgi:hypothetical protein